MCGICGWIDREKVDKAIMTSMTRELSHRGPDALRVEVVDNIGLGHARLSIIDLSADGNQPMYNEDQSIVLVYNGEFYNFADFRDDLSSKGHRFRSRTDSEVIIHLYEEEGIKFVDKIRGMFALAIWDSKSQVFFLMRDRVGIKPLYYFNSENGLIFASELKAILKHPRVSKEIDAEALHYYLMLGYVPKHLAIIKKIRKLLPGHYLEMKNFHLSVEKYWDLPETTTAYLLEDEEDLVERLICLLNDAVKLRLVSDVPVGVFLSGGIDSSIVSVLAAKNSAKPIQTFSIGFDDAKYNELAYAGVVARHIGSEHHEFKVGIDEAEVIEKLVYFFDEPFADSSAIPTYYVSKIARGQVKVALSGDGGDELFGGYNWYDWVLKLLRFHVLPKSARRLISETACFAKGNFPGKHFLSSLGLNEYETLMERVRFFSETEIQNIMRYPNVFEPTLNIREHYNSSGNTPLERMCRTDFKFYLPDDILTKVDRASMAVGLEARVPFLDHRVCEFAFTLDERLKIRNGTKKYILKKVAAKLLPADLHLERKQGFSVPLKDWMTGTFGDRLLDVVGMTDFDGYLNRKAVLELLAQHRNGHADNSQKLWAILILGLWHQMFS